MSGDKPIVYIVDDDPSIRRALGRVIKGVSLDVETFPSAGEFLEYERRDRPACLVLDIRMDGMSGRDLKTRLDKTAESLPVIFISAHDEELARARAEEEDAVAYLEKPFQEEDFLKAVFLAMGRYGKTG